MSDITTLAAKLKEDAIDNELHTFMAVKPSEVKSLVEALEAAEIRIAELTGKPAEDYADDCELLFEIDFCDDLSTSIQVAQWLKELRIRRAAGIKLQIEG